MLRSCPVPEPGDYYLIVHRNRYSHHFVQPGHKGDIATALAPVALGTDSANYPMLYNTLYPYLL